MSDLSLPVIAPNLKAGERVEVVVEGTVTEDGYLRLDDGSVWNFMPKAAKVRRVES